MAVWRSAKRVIRSRSLTRIMIAWRFGTHLHFDGSRAAARTLVDIVVTHDLPVTFTDDLLMFLLIANSMATLICSSNGHAFLQTFSIGMWAFGALLQQLAGFGIDTDFMCHAAILDIEGVA
jgi:hypothetical protein